MKNLYQWPYMALGKTAPDVIWNDDGILVWDNEGPKYPIDNGNGGGGGGGTLDDPPIKNPKDFRAFLYSGVVRDAQTETPLPGATVILYANGQRLAATAADNQGQFQMAVSSPAEAITISNVGYQTFNWPASEYQHTFDLERNEKVEDPVVVTAGYGRSWLWMGLLLFGAWQLSKRK